MLGNSANPLIHRRGTHCPIILTLILLPRPTLKLLPLTNPTVISKSQSKPLSFPLMVTCVNTVRQSVKIASKYECNFFSFEFRSPSTFYTSSSTELNWRVGAQSKFLLIDRRCCCHTIIMYLRDHITHLVHIYLSIRRRSLCQSLNVVVVCIH